MLTPDFVKKVQSNPTSIAGGNSQDLSSDSAFNSWLSSSTGQTNTNGPVGDAINGIGSALKNGYNSVQSSVEGMANTLQNNEAGNETRTPIEQLGSGIATGADLAGQATALPFKAIGAALPQGVKDVAGAGVNLAVNSSPILSEAKQALQTPEAQQAIQTVHDLAVQHPEIAQFLGGVGQAASNMAMVAGGGEAGTLAKDTAGAVGDATKAGMSKVGDVTDSVMSKTPILNSITPTGRDAVTVQKRMGVLDGLAKTKPAVQKALDAATSKGIDAKQILSNTDILNGAVDGEGTISTRDALENFDNLMAPYEAGVRQTLQDEGATVSLKKLDNQFTSSLKSSDLQGSALTKLESQLQDEFNGLAKRADANGNIPLTAVHDAKVFVASHQNYVDSGANAISKDVARALKNTVENNTQTLDVAKYNQALSQQYAIRDVLEALNGKKVLGGRLGKYFATTIGAGIGAHVGGPLGGILGAETGNFIKTNQLRGALGSDLNTAHTLPSSLKDALDNRVPLTPQEKIPTVEIPKQVPKGTIEMPRTESKVPQEKRVGNLKITQMRNTTKTKSAIEPTVPPKAKSASATNIPSSPEANLTKEAQKYSSAEDFVKKVGKENFDFRSVKERVSKDTGEVFDIKNPIHKEKYLSIIQNEKPIFDKTQRNFLDRKTLIAQLKRAQDASNQFKQDSADGFPSAGILELKKEKNIAIQNAASLAKPKTVYFAPVEDGKYIKGFSNGTGVIYFETPKGQVSFHTKMDIPMAKKLGIIIDKNHKWSGLHNSTEIVNKLNESELTDIWNKANKK